MGSYLMEDFVGNGVLKALLPKLLEDGWDDVPTLKIMNADDMNALTMTQQQKDALEIRTYLHDCALLQYADKLEASGKSLPELLNYNITDLSTRFGMKRGHVARFTDRTNPCTEPSPKKYVLSARKLTTTPSGNNTTYKRFVSAYSSSKSPVRGNSIYEKSVEQSLGDFKIKDGYVFRGIVASAPAGPRGCGCIKPPPMIEEAAHYSGIEGISVQKLSPEYKTGMERLVKTKGPPLKASELWRDKPALLLCIRRPGYIA